MTSRSSAPAWWARRWPAAWRRAACASRWWNPRRRRRIGPPGPAGYARLRAHRGLATDLLPAGSVAGDGRSRRQPVQPHARLGRGRWRLDRFRLRRHRRTAARPHRREPRYAARPAGARARLRPCHRVLPGPGRACERAGGFDPNRAVRLQHARRAAGGRRRRRRLAVSPVRRHCYARLGVRSAGAGRRRGDRAAARRDGVAAFPAGGSLAFLPLRDGRCSIVWSTRPAQAQELLQLAEAGSPTWRGSPMPSNTVSAASPR